MTLQPKSPRVGRSPKLKAKWLSNTLAYQYGNNGTKKSEIIVLSNDLDQYLQVKSHYPLLTYQKVSERYQKMPRSQTADQPTAPYGKFTEHRQPQHNLSLHRRPTKTQTNLHIFIP